MYKRIQEMMDMIAWQLAEKDNNEEFDAVLIENLKSLRQLRKFF